jgi:hypothetical protein
MSGNSGQVDYTRMYNFAGMDDIVGNERTRAQPITTTFTGAVALGSSYTTSVLGQNWINGYGTPRTGTGTNNTFLAADMLTGIITYKPTAAATINFDSAANLVSAVNAISAGAVVGDVIQCLIINGSAGTTMTLTTPSASVTFDTNQANTTITGATSKYIYFRLGNVTSGTEAYTIYM